MHFVHYLKGFEVLTYTYKKYTIINRLIMKKSHAFVLIWMMLLGAAIIGFSIYFAFLYFNREQNQRFKAAYIYDEGKTEVVEVDLGTFYPGDKKELDIPVYNRISKDIQVEFTFKGDVAPLGDYINVYLFDYEPKTINSYIESEESFKFRIAKEKDSKVKLTYELLDKPGLPTMTDFSFTVNFVATDVPYLGG